MKKGRNKEKILDKKVNDFRILLGGREYVPIMTGGMGVDISTSSLALKVASLGGIGHISDAMAATLTDRRYSIGAFRHDGEIQNEAKGLQMDLKRRFLRYVFQGGKMSSPAR